MCVDMRISKNLQLALWLALAFGCRLGLTAAIVGTNPPAPPLTAERIASLPTAERGAWTKYLQQSEQQRQADQQSFFTETQPIFVSTSKSIASTISNSTISTKF